MPQDTPDKSVSKPASGTPDPFDSIPINKAIERCCQAWLNAVKRNVADGNDLSYAHERGRHDFRLAMPPLMGYENIRDFIACTAQGIILGAIDHKESAKLLYAAQVATSILRARPENFGLDG